MQSKSHKMNQVEALKNKRSIQNFLDEAHIILENPIAMFDTEYRLQAYTSVITDDPIWNELVTYGEYSYKTQVLFMEEGFVDAVANTKVTAYLASDKLKYDRIYGKLYNEHNIHVANLILIACERPFNDDDLEIFEAICNIFSKKIIRSGLYQTYGKLYQENYIRKLINGEITDRALYAAHIAIVYNNFNSSMRLLVADIGKNNSDAYSKITYFRDLFRQTQSKFIYAIYSKYILIIMGSDNKQFDAKKELGSIYKLCEKNGIYCGVSNRFDNLYELRKHYFEAIDALSNGLNENLDGWLFLGARIEDQT